MMGGSPSWWSMHSDLRSSSTSDHHQSVAPSLLLSQTHPYTTSDHPNHYHHNLLHPLNNINIHNSSTSSSPSSSSSSSSSSTSSLLPFSSLAPHHHDQHRPQDFPHSWSQLLLGGLVNEQEERFGPSLFQSTRVMGSSVDDVKQEVTSPNNNNNNNNNLFGYHNEGEQEAGVSNRPTPPWSLTIPISSPKSCITSLSSNSNNNINNNNNMLDFSTSKISLQPDYQQVDHSNFECNSTTNGGIPNKKPKVQSSSNPPLKVRKEKLGDRITALHQLVSPFGKTDTASVLLEAIGYIRFLQGQIEALSTPYMGNNNASNQHSVRGERNCLFPDHPGQLLNDSCLKRRGAATQEDLKDASKDLKSRGLCLVPISCTQLVGSDNGADYWAPSLGGGF